MDFVTIPAGEFELGWRFTALLPDAVFEALAASAPLDALIARFSPRRKAVLAAFEIATTTIPLEELLGDPYELSDLSTLERLDERLADDGLRLPTEDELEAAAGGELFPWGMAVPDGLPYGRQTSFLDHRKPSSSELMLNHDPTRSRSADTP